MRQNVIVLFVFLSILLLPLGGMQNLCRAAEKASPEISSALIKLAQDYVVREESKKGRGALTFGQHLDTVTLSPGYTSISYTAFIRPGKGDLQQPAVIALLFKEQGGNAARFSKSYLYWGGEQEIKQYKGSTITQLCQAYQGMGEESVCALSSAVARQTGESPASGQTEPPSQEQSVAHKHASKDIIGVLEDAKIPAAVVRESELKTLLAGKADAAHNHDQGYVSRADYEALEKRISVLESGLISYTEKLEKKVADQEATVAQLVKLLADVSRTGADMVFKGINVHIVNGTGATDGPVNGRGNLIIGYNEPRGQDGPDIRVGSHNIVVGSKHNYASFGGLLVGAFHTVAAPYSSISGGYGNTAEGSYSTVAGGQLNKASGKYATVSGGMTRSAAENNNWQGGKFSSER